MRTWMIGFSLMVSAGGFAGAVGAMELASRVTFDRSVVERAPPDIAARPEPARAAPEAPKRPNGADRSARVVEVPDLTGTTALRALERARELGFAVDLRDEHGWRVAPSAHPDLRVLDEGQSPPPGSFAERGSTIRLVVRYLPRSLVVAY